MRAVPIVALLALAGSLTCAQDAPAGAAPVATLVDSKDESAVPGLKVCLRLEDETPFAGPAAIRLLQQDGNEWLVFPKAAANEFLFSGIAAGKYLIAVGAPGYEGLQLTIQLDGGPRQKTLFIPMKSKVAAAGKPKTQAQTQAQSQTQSQAQALTQASQQPPATLPDGIYAGSDLTTSAPAAEKPKTQTRASQQSLATLPDGVYAGSDLIASVAGPMPESHGRPKHETSLAAEAPPTPTASPASSSNGEPDYWEPHELEQVPPVEPNVTCPTDELLHAVGQRVSEFVDTLERFTATERLEHFSIQASGARKGPEKREFNYLVSVEQNQGGTFWIEEYRNGGTDTEAFPAHTATRGSPAMALIFHPKFASGFVFRCEGMGTLQGHPVWQVHFVQRPDKPIMIRRYRVNTQSVDVPLEGRAWIAPDSFQIERLETELVKPLPEIALTREHFAIDYRPEQFRSTGQQLWLPHVAELYVERKGKRFYRRHSFSDFVLFNVDVDQSIRAPEESFGFTNSSDHDVLGELTVSRRPGAAGAPITLRFVVPAHASVFKVVGPNKDVKMPVLAVGEATFVHEGDPGAIKVESHTLKETSLSVVAQTPLAPKDQPSTHQ